MTKKCFQPEEVLFCPTTQCNLSCAHCDIEQNKTILSKKTALKFLNRCANAKIKRVGFTGGEPFLALDFLLAITKGAIRHNMFFNRIMTNAVWFKTNKELVSTLNRLFRSGYDGDFCISVDAFHRQDLHKVASFIKVAKQIWGRPDVISIASIKGAKEKETIKKLKFLACLLNAGFLHTQHKPASIKGENLFIKIIFIDLSATGKAERLKNGWDGKWFRDDFCKGPGNVFFVLPNGDVKPCCGYATDSDILTIGSIKHDSVKKLLQNTNKNNRFVASVFKSGLHLIRKYLEKSGVRFPGKTSNHCFFCYYLTHQIPRPLMNNVVSDL